MFITVTHMPFTFVWNIRSVGFVPPMGYSLRTPADHEHREGALGAY